MTWIIARAASDLRKGSVILLHRRPWWKFWQRNVVGEVVAVKISEGEIDRITGIRVNGQRVRLPSE
jgi:hypothetical protein